MYLIISYIVITNILEINNYIKIWNLTVIVSTVRVLLDIVWELTISPVALYIPSSLSTATFLVSVATSGTVVVVVTLLSGSPL